MATRLIFEIRRIGDLYYIINQRNEYLLDSLIGISVSIALSFDCYYKSEKEAKKVLKKWLTAGRKKSIMRRVTKYLIG